jgi:outer membrane protein assembly factor BamB
LVAPPGPPTAQETTGFQADAGRDGWQPGAQLSTDLVRRWGQDLGGYVTSPVVADGSIFTVVQPPRAEGEALYALDPTTGRARFAIDIGKSGVYNTGLASAGGRIFVLTNYTVVRAFDAATGAPLWAQDLARTGRSFGQDTSAAVTAADGLVLVSGSPLVALDATTGQYKWSTSSTPEAPVAAVGNRAWLSADCGAPEELDLDTGRPIWTDNFACSGPTGVAVEGNRLVVYSQTGLDSTRLLDATTGAALATLPVAAQAPALTDTLVYQIDHGTLEAFGGDGSRAWSFVGDGLSETVPPLVVGTTVYILSNAGNLYGLDAATGKQILQTSVGAGGQPQVSQSMATDGGSLFVPAGTRLVALAASKSVPPHRPGPPAYVEATASDASAYVTWTPPADDGGNAPIVSYTVTAIPGGQTATVKAPASGVLIGGLRNFKLYHFTVQATNGLGSGVSSAPSLFAVEPIANAWTLIPLSTAVGADVSQPTALNDSDEIVGRSQWGLRLYQASWQADNVATTIVGSPLLNSFATAVNDHGDTAGTVQTPVSHLNPQGYLLGQTLQTFPDPSTVTGLNLSDEVVGSTRQAASWSNGLVTKLGAGFAQAIDNAGTIVGTNNVDAVSWTNATEKNLGSLGGSAVANAISPNGRLIVGSSYLAGPDAAQHAAIFSKGKQVADLGPSDSHLSEALGVNDNALIVGDFRSLNGSPEAMIIQNGQLLDANNLVAPDPNWHLSTALAVNQSGVVIGTGYHLDPYSPIAGYDTYRGFILFPPGTPAGEVSAALGSAARSVTSPAPSRQSGRGAGAIRAI